MHPGVVSDTIAGIERAGGSVMLDPATDLLLVNAEVSLSIVIVRCRAQAGGLRWKLRLDTSLMPDITVAVRMDADNRHARDYYLLPWLDIGSSSRLRMGEENGIYLDAYRSGDLAPLYHLMRRHPLVRAA
jgi:hypothetical protein